MIEKLKISYEQDGNLSVTLSVETGRDDNLPYNLAQIFAKVMKDSSVNTDLVIEQLKEEFDFSPP